ncbi:amino acid oxidase [Cutibacterium sp. WCA-380-WT-3A]|uniref:Amino acid oxidase n=1 Tax=Cutibacterium porci TaxID=2605781 RepID=A0A7K0J4R5_9ACTN|nr:amino acid oxidase [Cutibacterium porci]MSS44838.1 amino acid oxidase [Cutibacterium porci]
MNKATIRRRTVIAGTAWAAPVVISSSRMPAFAASTPVPSESAQYGLFVTAGSYSTNNIGYDGTDNPGVVTAPKTPDEYFAQVKAGTDPDNDIAWTDSNTCYSDISYFRNGEGSFTPVTNSATGSPGSYASSSGFWWSVPTTSLQSGTAYIPGSSATLQAGATFVTEVELIVPPEASFTATNIRISGFIWNKQLSGKRALRAATAANLASQTVAGTWSITAPTTTTLPDGSIRVTGTLTYQTTAPFTVTQKGTVYYGQTEFMPNNIQVMRTYGWTSFSLTSSVQSATITYTGQPADSPSSRTLFDQLLTTSKIVNKSC